MAFVEERTAAGGHIEWRVNRPERANALGTAVAAELSERLDALVARLRDGLTAPGAPRSVTLSATPLTKGARRLWIAGGDLVELAALREKSEGRAYAASLSRFCAALSELPLPVIVAVDGAAIGGGAELVLAGDLRYGTRATTLDFKQMRAGLATGYGSCVRLVQLVGLARAQEILLTGRELEADQALEIGLLHKVLADEAALTEAVTKARKAFAERDVTTLATQKRMLTNAASLHPGAARAEELRLFEELWMSDAHARFLADFARRSRAGAADE